MAMSEVLQHISQRSSTLIHPEALGQLHIRTGRIVACDPLVSHNKPFERTVPTGSYPVIAWWHSDEERIAAAELRLSEAKAVRWEMATRPGQLISELKEGYTYGYPVDTGLGCFGDEAAIHAMNEMEDRLERELGDDFISFYDDAVADVLAEHNDDWGVLSVDQQSGLNVIMFSTGYGDGFYTSYWGFDEEDKLVALVTDFKIL